MAEPARNPADRWLNYVALTTVILAVAASPSTFKGNQLSTRAVLSQSQASDRLALPPSSSPHPTAFATA